jgi:hypothetical protein
LPGLQARSNTMCVDVPGGSSQEGLRLQLWHCHGSDSQGAPQRWQFIFYGTDPAGHPAYVIRNIGNNLCMTWGLVFNPNPPGNIFQEPCPVFDVHQATLWVILDGSLQTTRLEAAHVNSSTGQVTSWGFCLRANDSSDANGTPLSTTTACARDADEVWALG